ncbi:MAG: 16S rRNA (guanine(966)-N(2))-methyltransferase RsmD [Candidatus Dadabacteria bacterium]|nr:MAG: 16S rRNA (guanine(966)-N(2))-methyltransferase RsmD [Candidatus Dadabacteria bacterium]
MRVIAGQWRGRRLPPPPSGTRPTPERAREALFSMLYSRGLEGSQVRLLDLFCGSGAIGIEALSRGAGTVGFVDRSRRALTQIERFVRNIDESRRFQTRALDLPRQIPQLAALRTEEPYNVIFCDPPFSAPLPPAVLLHDPVIDELFDANGLVIWEQQAHDDPEAYAQVPGWETVDERRYGRVRFWFYRRE